MDGAGQAQRPSEGAIGKDRAGIGQCAGGAGDLLCPRGPSRSADAAHAISRNHLRSRSIFEKTLEYAARSFRRAGFRDIVFLGDHGGYQKSEIAVATRLNREWHAQATRVHAIDEYYRATQAAYVPMLKRRGFSDEEIGSHAGLADTALTLALAPDLVRTDGLASAGKPSAAQGVYGDPRRATAELGQLGVDIIIAQTIEAIRKATRRQ